MKMKISSLNQCLTAALLLFLCSCVSNKGFQKPFLTEHKSGMEQSNNVFIIKKTGQKITGSKLSYSPTSIWRVKQKEDWIAVDGEQVYTDECEIIQTTESYKRLFKPAQPVYQPAFFISRLRYGRISLYYYEHEAMDHGNDVRGAYHVYVFEKQKDKLEEMDYESFAAAVKDNAAASQKFRELYPNSKIPRFNEKGNLKNLLAVVELYNR
jgi:hypothetical protein